MCRQCVRGGCASLEMGAHPLIARLRQHVVPPQPPQLFSIRLPGRAGEGRAGQGRAGQGRAGQVRAGQRRAGQGRAVQGRAGGRAGQGAGQGRGHPAKKSFVGRPHRSDGTLGRGARSRQFRVEG